MGLYRLAFPEKEPEPKRSREDMPEDSPLGIATEMEYRAQRIIASNPPPLSAAVINAFAEEERRQRVTALAAESAGSFVPLAGAHAKINRLLTERETLPVDSWEHGRSAASHTYDDMEVGS